MRLNIKIIAGNSVDIMNPRAIGACNEKIAQQLIKIIREADQLAEMKKH